MRWTDAAAAGFVTYAVSGFQFFGRASALPCASVSLLNRRPQGDRRATRTAEAAAAAADGGRKERWGSKTKRNTALLIDPLRRAHFS